MDNRNVIGIGASAGGIEALLALVKRLPADLPATVLVTLHLAPQFKSSLDDIMTRAGPLPAEFATDGQTCRLGALYIAPPDRHLLLDGERLRLGTGPRENNSRPAIDPMMRSIAACCGARAIGVVLTGTLGDGASGLYAVAQCGGLTVVQDPKDAAFPEMPLNALKKVSPDFVIPMAAIPAQLAALSRQPAGDPVPVPGNIAFEIDVARGALRDAQAKMDHMDQIGRRSLLACPDCHGVMWEIDEGDLTRYRCHAGHAYTAELMSLALDESLRRALASAERALEERVVLTRKLHRQADERQHRALAADWASRVAEAEEELKSLHNAIARVEESKTKLTRSGTG